MDILWLTHSLLKLSEDLDTPVLSFHKSFPDFITDPHHCPDKMIHISPRNGHPNLALGCLKLMSSSLECNPLSLPSYVLNSEVEDLEVRINNCISAALEYACKSWHNHQRTLSPRIHHHRTQISAFGGGYYNESMVGDRRMITICSSQLEIRLLPSDVSLDTTISCTMWKLERSLKWTKHPSILNKPSTTSTINTEMNVTSITTVV